MTKAEQKQRVKEFVARGEEIGKAENTEFGGLSQVKGPQYETWMSEINVFNERYLRGYPLYSDIHSTYFHRNTDRNCYQNMMGHLQALASDAEYWEEPQRSVERSIIQAEEKGTESNMAPIIFISHRTEDAEVADMLRDYRECKIKCVS